MVVGFGGSFDEGVVEIPLVGVEGVVAVVNADDIVEYLYEVCVGEVDDELGGERNLSVDFVADGKGDIVGAGSAVLGDIETDIEGVGAGHYDGLGGVCEALGKSGFVENQGVVGGSSLEDGEGAGEFIVGADVFAVDGEALVGNGGVEEGGNNDFANGAVDKFVGDLIVGITVEEGELEGDGFVLAGFGGVVVGVGDEVDVVAVNEIGGDTRDEDKGVACAVVLFDQLGYAAFNGDFARKDVGGVGIVAGVGNGVVAALGAGEEVVYVDGFVVAHIGVEEGGSGTVGDGVVGENAFKGAGGFDIADDGAVIHFVALQNGYGSVELTRSDVGGEGDVGRGEVVGALGGVAVEHEADGDIFVGSHVGVFVIGEGRDMNVFAADDAIEGAYGGDGCQGATVVYFVGVDGGTRDGQLFRCDAGKEGIVLRGEIVGRVGAANGVGYDDHFDAAYVRSEVVGIGIECNVRVFGKKPCGCADMGD